MRASEGYVRAESVEEAIEALASSSGDAVVLAGGTVVGSLINQHLLDPSLIVDISRIAALRRIARRPGGGLLIGPLATHSDVLASPIVREQFPLMSEVGEEISCARLRNRGTVGGSLCSVGSQGDTVVALLAVGANLKVRGPGGERLVAIEDLYRDGFSTVIEPDELLVDVEVMPTPPEARFAFSKLGPRKAMDFTLISVALSLTRDAAGKAIRAIRIGINGATETAIRPRATEAALIGTEPESADWQSIAAILDGEISPTGDLAFSEDYKRHVTAVLVQRTVKRAWSRYGAGGE